MAKNKKVTISHLHFREYMALKRISNRLEAAMEVIEDEFTDEQIEKLNRKLKARGHGS